MSVMIDGVLSKAFIKTIEFKLNIMSCLFLSMVMIYKTFPNVVDVHIHMYVCSVCVQVLYDYWTLCVHEKFFLLVLF